MKKIISADHFFVCPITLDEFSGADIRRSPATYTITPCCHNGFITLNLMEWLRENSTCPCCRRQLVTLQGVIATAVARPVPEPGQVFFTVMTDNQEQIYYYDYEDEIKTSDFWFSGVDGGSD